MSGFFNSGAKKADLPIYTKEEVAMHKGPEDIWIIINGNVYNFSKFQYRHPGGRQWMVQYAGLDTTNVFMSAHHRDEPKPKDMIGRLSSKAAEVEAQKKGSLVKKLFNWGKKGEDNGAPDTEKYGDIGFATRWQGPKYIPPKLEPTEEPEGTKT